MWSVICVPTPPHTRPMPPADPRGGRGRYWLWLRVRGCGCVGPCGGRQCQAGQNAGRQPDQPGGLDSRGGLACRGHRGPVLPHRRRGGACGGACGGEGGGFDACMRVRVREPTAGKTTHMAAPCSPTPPGGRRRREGGSTDGHPGARARGVDRTAGGGGTDGIGEANTDAYLCGGGTRLRRGDGEAGIRSRSDTRWVLLFPRGGLVWGWEAGEGAGGRGKAGVHAVFVRHGPCRRSCSRSFPFVSRPARWRNPVYDADAVQDLAQWTRRKGAAFAPQVCQTFKCGNNG